MKREIPESWGLGFQELEEIFRVEVEFADKLRAADPITRKQLYTSLYEEYFRKLPFHPQLTIKKNNASKSDRVAFQLRQILPFLNKNKTFMELGAGDCSLSIAAIEYCNFVYAMEVSGKIAENSSFPDNVHLSLFDGFNIPLPDNSIDVAYSNQVMEHLHPDDAKLQLKSILRVLKNGGFYICITPNRISGPHDISRFFTDRPVGFHLKEYSAADLRKLFLQIGFSNVIAFTIFKGLYIEIPFFCIRVIEWMLETAPWKLREMLLRFRPVKFIFHAIIAAVK